ncbi:hypothetical protein ACVW19_006701 [Streptomyces sp. TE5632]
MEKKNIFVIGLEDSTLPTLHEVPDARSLRFHQMLTIEELQAGEVSLDGLIKKAEGVLDGFEESIDAIVGYWDFPVSTLVPILAERYGTRSTSLESVVKCEHRHWSRLEQQKVTDRHPRFGMVDLESDDPVPPDGVTFPMWLKPAPAYSSELAFGVKDQEEFRAAVKEIRSGIVACGRRRREGADDAAVPAVRRTVRGQVGLVQRASGPPVRPA